MRGSVVAIVGSGFGLYGYMPALIELYGCRIVLAERYRPTIEVRRELRQYLSSITWTTSVEHSVSCADGSIVAVAPSAQAKIVNQVLSSSRTKFLMLEKPICPSPRQSQTLITKITNERRLYRVGYTFLAASWYEIVHETLSGSFDKIVIKWSFKANHFSCNKDTWKRYHSQGGGALRFYGIHLIAILSSWGYTQVENSRTISRQFDEPESWFAMFKALGLPSCEVHVATNSRENKFEINALGPGNTINPLIRMESPFSEDEDSQGQDQRVPILGRLLDSFEKDSEPFEHLYRRINSLWHMTESLTVNY